MKAALYTRVSGEDQVDGFSLPAQIRALEDYCAKNGVEVYKTYCEEGVSAKYSTEKKRPQFERMLKDAEKKLFNLIIVHKYDRFARNVELSQRVKRQLKEAGVNVISITEPIEDSPIGFFQEGILELLAEYYIRNLSAEVKKGQREKVSQGQAVNMAAYGYKNIKGKIEIVPEQAEVIKKMFHMYSSGHGTMEISNELNGMGIPTLKQGKWGTSQINYILKNVTYIGVLKWAGQYHIGIVPPIIDKKLFDIVQSIIGNRTVKHVKRKELYKKFVFLGLLYCGYCGAPMRISRVRSNGGRGNQVYYYYTCSRHRYDKNMCKFSAMFEHKEVDGVIMETIKEILYNTKTQVSIYNEDAIVHNRRQQIESELEKAKKAYFADIFSLEEYAQEKARLEDELRILESKKVGTDIVRDKIRNMLDEYKECKSVVEKKTKLQSVIKIIKVFEDSYSVEFHG